MAHSKSAQAAPAKRDNTNIEKNEWIAFRYSIHSECHKTFLYLIAVTRDV